MKVSSFSTVAAPSAMPAEEGFLVGVVNQGDLEKLKSLLQLPHIKADVKNGMGVAAFMRAACLDRVDMMELLSPKHGLMLNERNSAGDTALMQAAKNNSHAAMEWLIKDGADVNIMDDAGSTAFFEYIHSLAPAVEPSTEMVELFFNAYLDLEAVDAHGRNALMLLAARPGQAKYCLLQSMIGLNDLNAIDNDGHTALHAATAGRFRHFGVELARLGVKVCTVANDGRSALDLAKDMAETEDDHLFVKYLRYYENLQHNQKLIQARSERQKVLMSLREASLDEDLDDLDDDLDDGFQGGMAFDFVARQKIFFPALHETDFSAMNFINTPLLNAVKFGSAEHISDVLKSANVNINVQDPNGWSPLMYAATRNEKDFLNLFLDKLDEKGIVFDPNVVNDLHESALILMARQGLAGNMKLLLQRGAGSGLDVNIVDRNGHNALMAYIVDSRQPLDAELMGLLLSHKLDVACRTVKSQTTAILLVGAKDSADAQKIFLQAPGVVSTLDMVDARNSTALMYAVMVGDYEYFKLLIDAGANVNLEVDGYSARRLAQESGQHEFLALIDRIAAGGRQVTQAAGHPARMDVGD